MLTEPMRGHAIRVPLSETDPAPIEITFPPSTNHMHIATVSLGWSATLGTGLANFTDL